MINKKIAAMALSVCFWANYVCDKIKMCRKSENAVNNDRVLKFLYDVDAKHVEAVVQASMRNVCYRVTVSRLYLIFS